MHIIEKVVAAGLSLPVCLERTPHLDLAYVVTDHRPSRPFVRISTLSGDEPSLSLYRDDGNIPNEQDTQRSANCHRLGSRRSALPRASTI